MTMVAIWIILAVFYFVMTHLIAKYIGETRRIGYSRSLFYSILLSPAIGYFITKWSKPIE